MLEESTWVATNRYSMLMTSVVDTSKKKKKEEESMYH